MAKQLEKKDSNLNTLRDNVNQLETQFEKLLEDVISKLKECSDCIKSAKQLCHEATETTTILESKLVNASNEEKEWKDIKIKLATTSIQGKVILDIGSEKYTTSVEQLERDPEDKSIFIDRDGKLFYYMLAYLRTSTVLINVMKDETLLTSLIIEAEYFRLKSLLDILGSALFSNRTLPKFEHKKQLNPFYGKTNQQWELIYKATCDGLDANIFHAHCTNKGPTITIIQSNHNFLFGGYTAIPWTSDVSDKKDTTAFLFTLANPHNIPPTKYLISTGQSGNAVVHNASDLAKFGGGRDLKLANVSNANNSSYTKFPNTYLDTTGKGNNTFTGAINFTTSDIEVFKLA
ncbi:unnamed protein product [Rotaria socialis]|uniref:TLDc domain-containing protein n=1 Tax=Rotaria socialis TaxID=392032 RepID=A0A821CIM2_9BILA|nr:unnamed protein product [Rotaria socialis]CAF4602216.1 unnamed protein product [Rotaria socialis]